MKKLWFLVLALSALALAQPSDMNNSGKSEASKILDDNYPRHSIDLRISYWNNARSSTSVNVPGISIDVASGGISGEIMYNYYLNRKFAFNVSVGAMSNEVKVRTLSTYTSTVAPLMMGMKYYFTEFSKDIPFRPYFSGSVGILVGTESSEEILSIKEHMESAMGGYVGIGSDIILGSLIKLHTDIGYNLFTDFNEAIGSRKNYSGAEFSFGLGFMF